MAGGLARRTRGTRAARTWAKTGRETLQGEKTGFRAGASSRLGQEQANVLSHGRASTGERIDNVRVTLQESRGWCKKPAGKMVATWIGQTGRLGLTDGWADDG